MLGIVLALVFCGSFFASASAQVVDIATTSKAADKRIKELVKLQNDVQKQIMKVSKPLAKSPHRDAIHRAQAGLYAYKNALWTEQSAIDQIMRIARWDGGGGTPEGARAVRNFEFGQIGGGYSRGLPRMLAEVSAEQAASYAAWQNAPESEREKRAILEEAYVAYSSARTQIERATVSIGNYLAAVGAKSMDQYRAQLEAVEERERRRAEGRMKPEEAGAIVLGAMALFLGGTPNADRLRAEEDAARGRCAIVGGIFAPGNSTSPGVCSR
jgi:hypothetical protein